MARQNYYFQHFFRTHTLQINVVKIAKHDTCKQTFPFLL